MDGLQFYILFNSISVRSGQWADDNEKLCVPFMVEKVSPWAGIEPRTARSVGQRLTHWATGAPSTKRILRVVIVISHYLSSVIHLSSITYLVKMLESTVHILYIGTDRSQQTVQTKIRLLLKKQSDQGLHCLPFHQHLLDALMQCYIKLFYF